jgi:dephospho-CoA kinase
MREILVKTDTADVAFAEVPLLIETATQGWFDEVWVVSAGVEEQRRRLVERLGNEADADALLSTQLPTEAKIPFADRVVRTNMPLETVKSTLARHVKELLELR